MMRLYSVAIRKEYFPHDSHPATVTAFMESFQVRANTRTEAARKVWERHGERLLAAMKLTTSDVSLDVNDPGSGSSGRIGRLLPITVRRAT